MFHIAFQVSKQTSCNAGIEHNNTSTKKKENGMDLGVSDSNTVLFVLIISHSHTNKNSHEKS